MIPRAQSISRTYREYTGEVGCFVSVEPDVESKMKLLDWASRLGFELDPMEEARLHCTVMHSRDGAPLSYNIDPATRFTARLQGFEYWEGHDRSGYLVALLQSRPLIERHHYWMSAGADHQFGAFLPHVTLKRYVNPTDAMYQRMRKLADRERGELLSFYNEQIEDVKP